MATITVVVPLYNKEKFIRRSIESILGQSVLPLEILVVDDGSTDGSKQLVLDLITPLVRLIEKENGGVSSARNAGICSAKGEIVAFLDADDAWEPDFLGTIATLADQYPQAAVLTTGHRRIYRSGYAEISIASPDESSEFLVDDVFKVLLDYSFITSSNTAVRREAFRAAGMFREGENFGEDQDMWARLAFQFEVAHSKKILANYFCNMDSNAQSQSSKHNLRPPPLVSTLKEWLNKSVNKGKIERYVVIKLANRKIIERFEGAINCYPKKKCCEFLNQHYLTENSFHMKIIIKMLTLLPKPVIRLWSKVKTSRILSNLKYTFPKNRIDFTYRTTTDSAPFSG